MATLERPIVSARGVAQVAAQQQSSIIVEPERSLTILLEDVLTGLGRLDSLESTVSYLQGEWFNSESDLIVALEDPPIWDGLKLPSRLKLALKNELLSALERRHKEKKNKTVIVGSGTRLLELPEAPTSKVLTFTAPIKTMLPLPQNSRQSELDLGEHLRSRRVERQPPRRIPRPQELQSDDEHEYDDAPAAVSVPRKQKRSPRDLTVETHSSMDKVNNTHQRCINEQDKKEQAQTQVSDRTTRIWVRCFSPEHKCFYFFNEVTGNTQWYLPENVTEEEVRDDEWSEQAALQASEDAAFAAHNELNSAQYEHLQWQSKQGLAGEYEYPADYSETTGSVTASMETTQTSESQGKKFSKDDYANGYAAATAAVEKTNHQSFEPSAPLLQGVSALYADNSHKSPAPLSPYASDGRSIYATNIFVSPVETGPNDILPSVEARALDREDYGDVYYPQQSVVATRLSTESTDDSATETDTDTASQIQEVGGLVDGWDYEGFSGAYDRYEAEATNGCGFDLSGSDESVGEEDNDDALDEEAFEAFVAAEKALEAERKAQRKREKQLKFQQSKGNMNAAGSLSAAKSLVDQLIEMGFPPESATVAAAKHDDIADAAMLCLWHEQQAEMGGQHTLPVDDDEHKCASPTSADGSSGNKKASYAWAPGFTAMFGRGSKSQERSPTDSPVSAAIAEAAANGSKKAAMSASGVGLDVRGKSRDVSSPPSKPVRPRASTAAVGILASDEPVQEVYTSSLTGTNSPNGSIPQKKKKSMKKRVGETINGIRSIFAPPDHHADCTNRA
jgi:hypothetical protein